MITMKTKSKYMKRVQADETVNHIFYECLKLAQNEYKPGHDWIVKTIN